MRSSGSGGRGFSRDKSRFKSKGDGFRAKHGDRDKKPLFKAICAQCNKPCEVPFRPSGSKPVLCSYCFADQKDGLRPERPQERPPYHREATVGSHGSSQELKDISSKLDKIINLLSSIDKVEKPSHGGELQIDTPKEFKEGKSKDKKEAKAKVKKVSKVKAKPKKSVAKKDTKKKK